MVFTFAIIFVCSLCSRPLAITSQIYDKSVTNKTYLYKMNQQVVYSPNQTIVTSQDRSRKVELIENTK